MSVDSGDYFVFVEFYFFGYVVENVLIGLVWYELVDIIRWDIGFFVYCIDGVWNIGYCMFEYLVVEYMYMVNCVSGGYIVINM